MIADSEKPDSKRNDNKIGRPEIVGTQTPKEAAMLCLRNTIGNRRSDFNRPLHYHKLRY
jgi:hypothetical protein